MTHQPPIPAANASPYPLHPAPHAHHDANAKAARKAKRKGDKRKDAGQTGDLLQSIEALGSQNLIGLGIAAGLGTAAVVGALLFRRRREGSHGDRPATGRKPAASASKPKSGRADSKRVAAGQPYEVAYFARKHKMSNEEARKIIAEAGPSRDAANKLAESRRNA